MTNIDRIKQMYEAFGRGDLASLMESVAEDVVWEFEAPAAIPYAGSRRGKQEVLGFFSGIATSEENQALTITDYVASENKVATFGRYAGTVKSTGLRFDVALAHLFEFKDGKVARFVDYNDTARIAAAHAGSASAASVR